MSDHKQKEIVCVLALVLLAQVAWADDGGETERTRGRITTAH